MVKGSSIAKGSTFKTIKMEPAPTLEQWGHGVIVNDHLEGG